MLAPYRALLGLPGARRLVLSSIVGRIPYGMENLGILLVVRDSTGSFAAGGAVSAAYFLAICFGSPVQGRIIDRVGQLPVMLVCGVVHLLALVGLVAAGDAPVGVLAAFAAVGGAFTPPLSPALRTLWPVLVARGRAPREVLDTAYAFEAVAIEVLFVLGPLLAAGVIALASPEACVVVGAVLALIGSLAFATAEASRTWRSERTEAPHWLGPLRSRNVLVLLAVSVPHGTAVGLTEIALPAYADGQDARSLAGVLIAAWAVGSLCGGLYYGSRRFAGSAVTRLVVLHVALGVVTLPLALGGGIAPMTALCLLAGLPLASGAACLYTLLAELAPAGAETEANTWLISGMVAGLALGGLLSGVLVEGPGTSAAFAASAGVFVLAAAVAWIGRGALVARTAAAATGSVRSAA